jgi:6-phosphofructokinase 1
LPSIAITSKPSATARVEFLFNPNPLTKTFDGALVCLIGGELQYLKFEDLLDAKTKKTTVRTVDIAKPSYKVAREYMIRLEREDLEIPGRLEQLALAASSSGARASRRVLAQPYQLEG